MKHARKVIPVFQWISVKLWSECTNRVLCLLWLVLGQVFHSRHTKLPLKLNGVRRMTKAWENFTQFLQIITLFLCLWVTLKLTKLKFSYCQVKFVVLTRTGSPFAWYNNRTNSLHKPQMVHTLKFKKKLVSQSRHWYPHFFLSYWNTHFKLYFCKEIK